MADQQDFSLEDFTNKAIRSIASHGERTRVGLLLGSAVQQSISELDFLCPGGFAGGSSQPTRCFVTRESSKNGMACG